MTGYCRIKAGQVGERIKKGWRKEKQYKDNGRLTSTEIIWKSAHQVFQGNLI